jgi:hypothetical protein
MCGNHIIWGAQKALHLRIRHIGAALSRWQAFGVELQRYAEQSANDEEAVIAAARQLIIAGDREEVIERLFGLREIGLAKTTLKAGYDAVQPEQDGDPRSVWGMVQGLTRHSQTLPFADQRYYIDRAAGRLMEANF